MSKVSVALQGWRFDEEAIFDGDGDLKPPEEMPEDARYRIIRLAQIGGDACDACWLIHGEANIDRANQGDIVYGEPMAEVLLCEDHETDFLYWFREAGGDAVAGEARFPDEFHEWFAAGNRAPADYQGIEHVERDPGAFGVYDGAACGLDAVSEELEATGQVEAAAMDVDLDALDL